MIQGAVAFAVAAKEARLEHIVGLTQWTASPSRIDTRRRPSGGASSGSPISLKSEVNSQVWWRLLLLYPRFSGAAAGQFQPEQLWDGSSGGFNPLYQVDGPRSIRLAREVQF